eukprot:15242692-Alexandrium_andersonii.AAC.1
MRAAVVRRGRGPGARAGGGDRGEAAARHSSTKVSSVVAHLCVRDLGRRVLRTLAQRLLQA